MDNGLSRSDNEVLNIVTNYTKNNFSYINMILIAISNNCITEGVVSMMYDLLKFIGIKYHNNICLLITHCDNFSEKDEIEFIKSLSQNLAMKSFLVRINYRIIYTGKKELINPSDSNIFIERQVRFRTNFVNTLKLLDKTNLHNYNDLENVSPFDILESSIKINSVILTIPEKNRNFKAKILDLLIKLREFNLSEADDNSLKEIIKRCYSKLDKIKLLEVSDTNKNIIINYNLAEINFRKDSFELTIIYEKMSSLFNYLINIFNRFSLKTSRSEYTEDYDVNHYNQDDLDI